MLVPEGDEAMVGRHEEVVSGDMTSRAEGRSVWLYILGYIVPSLFLSVGDCPPGGECPSVDREGGALRRGPGECEGRPPPPAAFAVAVVEGDAAGGAVAVGDEDAGVVCGHGLSVLYGCQACPLPGLAGFRSVIMANYCVGFGIAAKAFTRVNSCRHEPHRLVLHPF